MPFQFTSLPSFMLLFVVFASVGFEWTYGKAVVSSPSAEVMPSATNIDKVDKKDVPRGSVAGGTEQPSLTEIPDNIKGRFAHSLFLCIFAIRRIKRLRQGGQGTIDSIH